MSRPPLRVALAGCGRLALRGYLPALALQAESLELVAVCDPDPARLEETRAAALGLLGNEPVCGERLEPLLESLALDAVVIASPAATHLPLSAAAAGAGVPALVEKPPALGVADAEALAALEPAPCIGFNRRFLQGAGIRDAVPAQDWLELDLRFSYGASGWGAFESRDPALLDLGVHLIDLALFISSSRAQAVRRAQISAETAGFELELGRGRARIRCAMRGRYREQVVVRDRRGKTISSSVLTGPRAAAARLRRRPAPFVASLAAQLKAFAAEVGGASGGEHTGLARAADGVAVMRVVEAVRRSAEMGGEVTVPQGPAPRSRSLAGAPR